MSTTLTWIDLETSATDHVGQLMSVVWGQLGQAMLEPNGWWDLACVNCERVNTFHGSLTKAAETFDADGWAVDSAERFTAICRACQNPKDSSTWASQYEDNRGLLG